MVNITKKFLEENLKKEIWNKFVENSKRIKSDKELFDFLGAIITPSEMAMIEKRLGIIYLLEKGLRYRDISEILDVMPCTISFVKRGFKKAIKKADKNRNSRVKEKIFDVAELMYVKNSKFPKYKGRGRWRFLNN